MPEIEITEKQLEKVTEWIKEKGGKRLKNVDGNGGSKIWNISGEPLVVHIKYHPVYTSGYFFDYWKERYFLLCSNFYAQRLEEGEIVNFKENHA